MRRLRVAFLEKVTRSGSPPTNDAHEESRHLTALDGAMPLPCSHNHPHDANDAPANDSPAKAAPALDPETRLFYDCVDKIIDLCNDLSKHVERPMLSAAVLYAAARYNAFHYQASRPGGEPDEALSYLGEQFITMMKENLALPLAGKAFNDTNAGNTSTTEPPAS
jgi:Protein of unknown function (DUF3144)